MKKTLTILSVFFLLLSFNSHAGFYKKTVSVNKEETKTFTNVSKIDLNTTFFNLDVLPSNSNETIVKIVMKGKFGVSKSADASDFEFIIEEYDGLVKIKTITPRGGISWSSDMGTARIQVLLPNKINRFNARTTSGDVNINNVNITNFNFSSTSGDYSCVNIESDQFNVTATSGDFEISDLKTRHFESKTTSGDQTLNHVKSNNYTMRCTSGYIKARGIYGEASLGTTSGDIEVMSSGGLLNITCTSGETEIRDFKGVLLCSSTSGDFDGNGIELTGNSNFSSTSGSTTLYLDNDESDIRFRGSGSSADLSFNNNSGSKSVSFGNGNIQITTSSTSGDVKVRTRK